MIRITDPRDMHRWVRDNPGRTRALVATMGALHEGHETLLQRAREENDMVVLSIFVNPAQFNVQSDFDNYPRTIERDLRIAEHHGVDVVYVPDADAMYPDGFASFVEPGRAAATMEGAGRPGHFRGVTTVVTKLFNAVSPQRAYFGKKDYQQLAVIRQMVQELDFPIDVIGIETVREADGLALSSRNARLPEEARHDAPIIHRAMREVDGARRAGLTDVAALVALFREVMSQSSLATVEYAEIVDAGSLETVETCIGSSVLCVAVWYGDVRLIDNLELFD